MEPDDVSISISKWPQYEKELIDKKSEELGDIAKAIISRVRQYKHDERLPLNTEIPKLIVECDKNFQNKIKMVLDDIKGTTQIKDLEFGKGNISVEGFPIKLSIIK